MPAVSPPEHPTADRIAIIGAGPAGLAAAYQLAKAGVAVDLYEASGQVGGLSKSIELWGRRVDLGPHRFFSRDPRVNSLWLEVVGQDYFMVERLTRIYYNGKLFYYPLQAANALRRIGLWEALRSVWSYGLQKLSPIKDDGSFENWVVRRFGRRLFELFFKSYSEKLWGIPTAQLDADFAAQRIKKLSLTSAVANAFKAQSGSVHTTLVDRFAYAKGGTGSVYERMAIAFETLGGRLFLNTPVQHIETTDHHAQTLVLADGRALPYRHFISSMPLSLLSERLPEAPAAVTSAARQLSFRSTILVYLQIGANRLFPDQWLYVHSPGLKIGRITNFNNWRPTQLKEPEDTVLALELWCNPDDGIWQQPDAVLIEQMKSELLQTQLVNRKTPITNAHIHRIRRCYPVYELGYQHKLQPVVDYLKTVQNLQVIGRYGAFKYNNQDHSLLMGILAAENVQGANHDLWTVNTDYEYQEEALITETGLVRA